MPLLDPSHPLAKLLHTDKRYKFEAYVFVFEALNYAHENLGMGQEQPPEEEAQPEPRRSGSGKGKSERHLTGQQLCEAVRQYALEQYGLMAKPVLNSWGVRSTGDIGDIVFNLIEAGQMRKTKQDRREDFDNVFDFDEALIRNFHITPPAKQAE